MCMLEEWVKGNSQMNYKAVTATQTVQQLWPPDPLRWCIIVPIQITSWVSIMFGTAIAANGGMFLQAPGCSPIITRAEVGELITLNINIQWQTAAGLYMTYALSYNAVRKQAYDDYLARQLAAKFGSS